MPNKINDFFSQNKSIAISFKAPWALKFYLNREYGLKPRTETKTSNKTQRKVEKEVKKARHLALLPFVLSHSNFEKHE
ncbi:MAG: hypothetical protein Fur0024_3080 [Patescibacteria group bacterium]